ncbi:MAG: glycosyltransferase family 39 protein [bacterium]|nr:glycosyltransferase family 39 protein [bacterium]
MAKKKKLHRKTIPHHISIKDKAKKFLLNQKDKFIIFGILLVGLILRLIYLSQVKVNDPNFLHFEGTDSGNYDSLAMQVLDGSLPKSPYSFNPLYYYFLAIIYSFIEHNPLKAINVQIFIGLGTCFLVYLIGKRLFNKSTGMIACGICAIYGSFMVYETLLLTTTLDTFLLLLGVFLLLKSTSPKWYFVTGIVLALSALSRSTTLLVLPFLFLWLMIKLRLTKKFAQTAGLIILGMCLTFAPFTYRNYKYSGQFILITTTGPVALWAGNNEDSEGFYHLPPYTEELSRKNKDFYLQDTIRFIKEKPEKYLMLLLKKCTLFWNAYEIPDNDVVYERFQTLSPLLRVMIPFGLVSSLGIMGLFLCLRRLNKNLFLLYLTILGYLSAIVLFFIQSRFRVPVVPFLSIFAGWTIYYWFKKLQSRKLISFFTTLILFIILYTVVDFHTFYGWTYPLTNPNGFCLEKREGFVFRDDSGDWHGDVKETIDSPMKIIKKEIIITQEVEKFEFAGISLNYCCSDKGKLLIKINDLVLSVINCKDIPYGPFVRQIRFKFQNPKLILKKGKNVITLSVLEGADVGVMVDNYYNFGRSSFTADGITWEKTPGEFMIQLELLSNPIY